MSPIASALLSVTVPAAAAAQENRTGTPIVAAVAAAPKSLMLRTMVALGASVTLASGAGFARGGLAAFDAEDALQRSSAAYAALTAYADSGTVVDDLGGFKDKYTFRTYFTRQPGNLFLDFT